MMGRQGVQQTILGAHFPGLDQQGLEVGANVVVGQPNAFGLPGRSAGEQ